MRIAILQTDIKWAQPYKNMAAAAELMAANKGADLYVLPEMWSTGFITEPEREAEALQTKATLEWMEDIARSNGCAVCGSIAMRTGQGEYRNRLYFVRPDGNSFHYDKRHLFGYGGECKHYTAGNERVIAEYGGMRFLLLTCYDLRFPVWARNKGDYDAMIVTANWPESRQNVWQILLRARAIENQCYVIGANRTGADPSCSYIGRSAIIDAKGATLAQAKAKKEQCVSAEISIGRLQSFRMKFPVLEDRDIFKIDHQ